ncbi:hypothetical protein [Lysinibacillus sp. 3P01SB]|uniref:hypothetical protein n=1 Tax=Lysinibacillus sp. 3P01SB TaxID=3132284 RepID=UPI0039A43A86
MEKHLLVTQLPLKTELTQKNNSSNINPTVGHKNTIRIVLYEGNLFEYNFASPAFYAMLQKITEYIIR